MRLSVWSLASLNGLRIQCCCELCCRSQTQLGSGIAVAPTRPLTWEPPYAVGVALKKKKLIAPSCPAIRLCFQGIGSLLLYLGSFKMHGGTRSLVSDSQNFTAISEHSIDINIGFSSMNVLCIGENVT